MNEVFLVKMLALGAISSGGRWTTSNSSIDSDSDLRSESC